MVRPSKQDPTKLPTAGRTYWSTYSLDPLKIKYRTEVVPLATGVGRTKNIAQRSHSMVGRTNIAQRPYAYSRSNIAQRSHSRSNIAQKRSQSRSNTVQAQAWRFDEVGALLIQTSVSISKSTVLAAALDSSLGDWLRHCSKQLTPDSPSRRPQTPRDADEWEMFSLVYSNSFYCNLKCFVCI